MTDTQDLPVWHINIARLADIGKADKLTADKKQREAIGRYIGVSEILRLDADISINPLGDGGAQLKAKIMAELVQPCVVTLAPMRQSLAFELDRIYELGDPARNNKTVPDSELLLDPVSDEPAEILQVNSIDGWAVIIEEMVLNIEYFPREKGVPALDEAQINSRSPEDSESPFAELSRLISKKNRTNGQ